MGTGRKCRITPLIRGSLMIRSNRSASSLMLSLGRDVNRCHKGGGGSGSAGMSFSRTKITYSGGLPIDRRILEISHHSQRNGKRIIPAKRLGLAGISPYNVPLAPKGWNARRRIQSVDATAG